PANKTVSCWTSTGRAVRPDGSVVFTDGRYQVLRIQPALPGMGTGNSLVPSSDGGEADVFDGAGRHLQTLDGLTGAVRWSFGYDAQQRLVTATDTDGNVIRIER